jgi:hypothetical protein
MCIGLPENGQVKLSALAVLSARRGEQQLLYSDVLFEFNFTLHANPEQTPAT